MDWCHESVMCASVCDVEKTGCFKTIFTENIHHQKKAQKLEEKNMTVLGLPAPSDNSWEKDLSVAQKNKENNGSTTQEAQS